MIAPRFEVGDHIIIINKFYYKVCKIIQLNYKDKQYDMKVIRCNKPQPMTWMGFGSIAEQRARKIEPGDIEWLLYV